MTQSTRHLPDIERFWSKVRKDGPIPDHCPELGPCWLWDGGRDASGYGIFYYHDEQGKTRKTRAHRWLLGHLRGRHLTRVVVGEEDGCHRCDNPPCCNPAHLYVGTRKQNLADAVERARLWQLKRAACPQGHPLDGVKKQRGSMRRYCKSCSSTTQRQRRTVERKTCKNGHALEGENIRLCKNGTRKCRICEEARVRKRWPERR